MTEHGDAERREQYARKHGGDGTRPSAVCCWCHVFVFCWHRLRVRRSIRMQQGCGESVMLVH